jgi:hypothetical protein
MVQSPAAAQEFLGGNCIAPTAFPVLPRGVPGLKKTQVHRLSSGETAGGVSAEPFSHGRSVVCPRGLPRCVFHLFRKRGRARLLRAEVMDAFPVPTDDYGRLFASAGISSFSGIVLPTLAR